MRPAIAFARLLALAWLACAGPAFAGGTEGGPEDVHEEGALRYFGFVKDSAGKAVPGARVGAEIKGFGTLVALSDATGAYRIPVPRVGKETLPNSVTVSCTKEGYRQVRALTKTSLNKKPLTAVEVECTLQRVAGK